MSTHRRTKVAKAATVRLDDLKSDAARVTRLASRPGGVQVMDGDRPAFRLEIPSKPLTE